MTLKSKWSKRRSTDQLELIACAERMPTPLSRATATRSKLVEAPAPKPWQAAVLGVDTARISGWSIYVIGRLIASGELDTLDEATIDQVVRNAIERADEAKVPLVMVLESAYGGSVDVISGLGVARERWLRPWRLNDQSPARVVRIQPGQWRGPVLGAYWVSQPRELVRPHEQLTAKALAGHDVGADEAPAILIGKWGSHSARVGHAIGKRAAKASLRAWTTARTK